MVPSNEYHYIGGAGAGLRGQLESCKEGKKTEKESGDRKHRGQRHTRAKRVAFPSRLAYSVGTADGD